MKETLLEVKGLKTGFKQRRGTLTAVDDVTFTLRRGALMGLVGESGSGKTQTALAIMGLLPEPGVVLGGEVLLGGEDLLRKSEKEMSVIRGKKLSMIFQDSLAALDPVVTCGKQMLEMIRLHEQHFDKAAATKKCIDALQNVGIRSPEQVLLSYPFELSGGMCQRVMIAMALLNEPDLLIADEPTTALDVTIQAQIVELLQRLCRERDMGVLIITHDLGVVAEICDRIAVMYLGKIMELGDTAAVIDRPRHPYTRGLLRSMPNDMPASEPLPTIPGNVPPLTQVPAGCRFSTRCTMCEAACTDARYQDSLHGSAHQSRCRHAAEQEEPS